MTQGEPLPPTIFNVVVDAVVHHWVTMALDEAEKRGERKKICFLMKSQCKPSF